MSNIKNKTANKSTSEQKISPTQDKPETEIITNDNISAGVSPFGVVFLSLLTTIALLTGTFAFREQIISQAEKYINIPTNISQNNSATGSVPGFVPVPTLTNRPENNLDSARLDGLESKINQLQNKLALAVKKAEPKIKQTDININDNEISELSDNLAITKDKLAISLAKISELENQITNLQNITTTLANKPVIPAQNNNIDIRGLIAFQSLQAKALSGQQFQASLQRVLALLEDSPSIEAAVTNLEKMAQNGRPSLANIQTSFQQAVSGYMQAGNNNAESIMGKVKHNLSSFIRVRRTDGSGDDNEKILANADNALIKGDVKTAYIELLKMDSSAKEHFVKWLPKARSYYQLPEWLEALQLQLANSIEVGE